MAGDIGEEKEVSNNSRICVVFFVFIPFVHAEDKTVNEKAYEKCLNYQGAKHIVDNNICPGAKVTFSSIPSITRYQVGDYREASYTVESYGADCRKETWESYVKKPL